MKLMGWKQVSRNNSSINHSMKKIKYKAYGPKSKNEIKKQNVRNNTENKQSEDKK